MRRIRGVIEQFFKPKPKPKVRRVRPMAAGAKQDPAYVMYRALPFKKRRMNFTDWIYKNKLGVSALVLLILVLFFSFSIVKFEISTIKLAEGFFVEVPPEVVPPEEKEPEKSIEQLEIEKQMFEDIRNMASNEDSRLDQPLKDDRGTNANDLYEEAKRLEEQLNRSSQAYNKGVQEAEQLAIKKEDVKAKKSDTEQDAVRKDVKVQGNVTVSYSLGGRNATKLPVPAYKCENAGSVVVDIVVNQNGVVESATVSKSSSKTDSCLSEVAVNFARQTRFELGTSWPQKHTGTITYMFLAQKQ